MEGDADGDQDEQMLFKLGEEDKLKSMIKALEVCSRMDWDPDSFNGNLYYDSFFSGNRIEVENYPDFKYEMAEAIYGDDRDIDECLIEEELEKYAAKINPFDLRMDHPSDSNYIRTSFESHYVIYVDENGDSSRVEILFSDEEIEDFIKCSEGEGVTYIP